MLLIPSDSFQTQPDECVPPIHVPYSYIAQFGGANWTGIVATAHTRSATMCYGMISCYHTGFSSKLSHRLFCVSSI